MDEEGRWVQAVRERWQMYNLAHPQTLERHRQTLEALDIAITTTRDTTESNATSIRDLVSVWKTAGVAVEVSFFTQFINEAF